MPAGVQIIICSSTCPESAARGLLRGSENSFSKYHILSEKSRAAPRAFGTPIQKDPLQDLQGQAWQQEESINAILLHDRQGRQGRALVGRTNKI